MLGDVTDQENVGVNRAKHTLRTLGVQVGSGILHVVGRSHNHWKAFCPIAMNAKTRVLGYYFRGKGSLHCEGKLWEAGEFLTRTPKLIKHRPPLPH